MTDNTIDGTLKLREEALRRKEKEVSRKEEQVKEQLDQIRSMRAAMDATLQELEARELVMTDAETKHGSLLQREEQITRRERDVDSKEETLRERLVEAAKREHEAMEFFKQRQREYEEKLFPLAAREQELVRREMEAQAMDHDLEIKYKQLNKHIAAEEEKEKVRDKSFRDREQALRDQTVATERKQQELEQLNVHLNEKQRLLKAEQVENDGRDREIKWREEQLRAAQAEVTELKAKLVKWEGRLSVAEEAVRVEQSRVALKLSELELKDTELVEKTGKLLAMDESIQKRDRETQINSKAVEDAIKREEARRVQLDKESSQLELLTKDLAERNTKFAALEKTLNERDAKLKQQFKTIEEREKSLKSWILELQYREQLVPQGAATQSPLFSANEIAALPLEAIQSKYIGTVSSKKPLHSTASASRTAGRMLLQPLQGGEKSTPRTPTELAEGQLAEAADSLTWEVKRVQLEERMEEYLALLYGMPDEERRNYLPEADEATLRQLQFRHNELTAELNFLWVALVGKQPPTASSSNAGRLTKELATFGHNFTLQDWSSFYTRLRGEAFKRRQDIIVESVAKLSEAVQILDSHVGSTTLAQQRAARDDLKQLVGGVSRIKHRELGKVLPMGRPKAASALSSLATHDHARSPSPPSSSRSSSSDRRSASPAADDSCAAQSAEKKKAHRAHSKKNDEVRSKLIASLPEYLRHHYEE